MRDATWLSPSRGWVRRPPFVGAYKKGRVDAFNGEDMRGSHHYSNRGWGHQFITAYEYGYRDQRHELAGQKNLDLE